MADKASKRFTVWVFVLSGFLIAILLTAFSIPWFIRSAETQRWEEMRRWCRDVAKEVGSRDSHRPVLRGVAVEGNAWDDYRIALASMGYKDVTPLANMLWRDSPTERSKAREWTERGAPALEALRRGASRSHARLRTEWESGTDNLGSHMNYLALLAACQARFLADEGRRREAMELLLDTVQYGEDAALNGSVMDGWIAMSPISVAMDELKELLSPRRMTRDDYQELDRELALLDQGFPREAEGYAIEAMRTGFCYLRMGNIVAIQEALGAGTTDKPTWRYGYSDRLVMADAFQAGIYWDRRMKEAAGKPWKEAREIQREVEADGKATRNPLLKHWVLCRLESMDPKPRNLFRERRAQLRLLRCAAAYRATGEVPVLDDPFGDKILSSIAGTRLKLWSLGNDGADDGAAGEWNPRKGKDIVLEIER